MIRKFLLERLSWIMMFLGLELLVLFIAFIDREIPFASLMYIVFLSSLLFAVFLTYRYHQETRFYQALDEWNPELEISALPNASRPFERIVINQFAEQTVLLKRAAASSRLALEEEKDELLAWIHEVKTPLTAMHLMIERLEDETIKSQLTYEWLRIHLLLDQQLHQKRMHSIENDLFIEQVELKSLLSGEIRALRSWCMRKGIGFQIELEEEHVLSDAKWLSFILRQLLTNAVKYSEASSDDIHIRSFMQDGHIILKVEDQGRGIDARDLPRIFEKGFTSTISHNDHKATGMGLYLAKKVADSLHIQIDIRSWPGAGTTVKLTFPKANAFIQVTSEESSSPDSPNPSFASPESLPDL